MSNPLHLIRGQKAEDRALGFLKQQGLKLLARNYSARRGELDLVMLDRETLVIVEVRYRKNSDYGHAAETVTPAKQRRIITATQTYLLKHSAQAQRAVRFDIVALHGNSEPEWIQNAFQAI